MTHAVKHENTLASADVPNPVNPNDSFGIPADPFAISEQWTRGNDFKLPFIYVVGVGKIEEEEIPKYVGKKQITKIRRLDMGDLLKLGVAEELDFMTKGLMNEEKPKTDPKDAVESVILKAGNYANMEKMVNTICLGGIIAPKLHAIPLHENARQKGLVYIDSIPFNDRMELFSVIFESEGLSTFRSEQTVSLGDVADEPGVSLPADGTVALRSDDA